jgi:hypothetical protein
MCGTDTQDNSEAVLRSSHLVVSQLNYWDLQELHFEEAGGSMPQVGLL